MWLYYKVRNTSQSFMSARRHRNSALQRHHTPHTAASDAADLGHFHVSVQEVEHRSKLDNLWSTLCYRQIHTLQQKFPESHGHTARFGSHHTQTHMHLYKPQLLLLLFLCTFRSRCPLPCHSQTLNWMICDWGLGPHNRTARTVWPVNKVQSGNKWNLPGFAHTAAPAGLTRPLPWLCCGSTRRLDQVFSASKWPPAAIALCVCVCVFVQWLNHWTDFSL